MAKLTLAEVQACLKEEFANEKWSLETVRQILESYDISLGDWRKFCQFDDHKYYRVVLDQLEDRYNLVLLCWNCGQGSPVHDHPTTECMFKVLEGTIAETRYDFPVQKDCCLEVTDKIVLSEGEVGHINDDQGIHRMGNESDCDTCVTLHCYFPPYKFVNAYDERTGTATTFHIKCELAKCPKLVDDCPKCDQ